MYMGIDNFVSAFSPLLILSDGTTFKKKDIGTLTSETKNSHFIHLSANTADDRAIIPSPIPPG